jgi:AcrR family transcriptional regulator
MNGDNEHDDLSSAVLEVLSGKDLVAVARKIGISVATLEAAQEKFIAAGTKAISVTGAKQLDRRSEIIWMAVKFYSDRGYNGTGLKDIAAALHMTRPALYYYFKDKDELLSAVIAEAASDSLKHSFSQARPDEGSAAEILYTRLKDRVAYFLGEKLPLYRMLLSERYALPQSAVDTLEEGEITEVRAVTALLTKGVEAGDLDVHSPSVTARLILSLLGAVPRWFDPKRANAEETADLVASMVLNGLKARDDVSARKISRPLSKSLHPSRK